MKLFGQVVRTLVNTALVPVAVVKDVVTLGGTVSEQNPTGHGKTYTREQLEKLAQEASEE